MPLLASFLSPMDMAIIAVLAVLLFGDRLPQVMRAVGQGVSEFKKGMREIENQIESATRYTDSRIEEQRDHDAPAVPQFQPPSAEPKAEPKSSEASGS
jgi:sec-independent protein translocase protein TatA